LADEADKLPAGGGGSATSAGILFEQQLGALIGSWMLTGRPIDQRLNLGTATVDWIRFETEAPVDDVLVATSTGGFIAIQAKTTASLSRNLNSPFGKTVEQFVRHWLASRDGDGKRHWNRPLDPARDRLVLAIGPTAPANIRLDLRAALRLRSQPGGAVLTDAQSRAFADFEACVEQAWHASTTEAYDAALPETLAGLICIFVFDPSGTDRELTSSLLRAAVARQADAPSALSALEAASAEMMAQRGGADLSTLRQRLQTKGVQLQAAPRFQADIATLRAHSEAVADSLQRYEVIEVAKDSRVSITRDCQAPLLQAALADSLLIVGEPGAGKSGVLNVLARDLRKQGKDVLQLAVDRYSVETLEGLKDVLRLEHPLLEVLDAWDGVESGWLVIDALDATRGGKGEGVFRTLIEHVLGRRGRWRVVASIRTFDLRMGQQFRSLFKGSPPVPELQEHGFSLIRHVCVPTWSAAEFERLLDSVPALSEALANAPDALRNLAAVPFNTRLLTDLVKDGLVRADFTHVASQAELLQLYWDHRVGQHGTPARACVRRIVDAMVSNRALRASIDAASGSDPSMIDQLAREGVIITVDNDRWIQFRHHLLFDFAAARVLLDPDAIVSGTMPFGKKEARGLMLAPALTFVLREIWDKQTDRADFWTAAATILADRESDPIIRSATSRICAEYPFLPEDARCLGKRIVMGNDQAARAFGHIAGALVVRLEDHPQSPISPWVKLLNTISRNVAPVAGIFRFLLFRLIASVTDQNQRSDLGNAARALLSYGYSIKLPRNLVSSGIDIVIDTFDTDPERSRALLARVFEPDRLLIHGSEEVPAITRKITLIAARDPAFTAEIYHETYAFEVTEERATPLGDSQILRLTSNTRQDYDMARYALGEFVPTFLRDHPDKAVAAIVDAMGSYVVRKHSITPQIGDHRLIVAGRRVRLLEDQSHVWAHDPESAYGHDADVLVRKLVEFLRGADEVAALHIAECLIDSASLAIFWSRLFMVAVERNDRLIDLLLPFATEKPFLMSLDTRKDAVDVVAKGYDSLSAEQRVAFERAVQGWNFPHFHPSDAARDLFLGRLFGAIGVNALATAEARALAAVEADGDNAHNDRLFVIRSSFRTAEPYRWIDDLDRDFPANQLLMAAIDATKAALGIDQPVRVGEVDSSARRLLEQPDILAALTHLANTIRRGEQNPSLVINAEGTIGQGLGRLISLKQVPTEQDADGTVRFVQLLSLVGKSDGPILREDTEANFERGASWSSPAPRVEAAQVILDLTLQRPDLYPTLQPKIDDILKDPHPAVRLQAGLRLLRIWDLDRAGFWHRLGIRLATEKNESVLIHLISTVLGRVLHEDPEATEQLVVPLLKRFLGDHERQARMRKTLADLVSVLWVKYQRDFAREILDGWVADAAAYHSELSRILMTMRGAVVAGLTGKANVADNGLRQRSQALAMRIVEAASAGLEAYFERRDPDQQDMAAARELAQLLDDACRELYFATGAGPDSSKSSRPIDNEGLAVFFTETAPILKRIGDFATPHTVYYLLQLLEFLLPVDPEQTFDLIAHALRGGGQRTGYQFEALGADLLVRLVGVFLADHKELFESEDRRAALIDCLEIFMDAGWPAAQRLLYRLPELIQ
jgi:hypothetical protein